MQIKYSRPEVLNHGHAHVFDRCVAQADSIHRCFSSGFLARHEPEAKQRRQRLISKLRGFLISCGWKIYSCCKSNNTTEDNICQCLYSTEEFALLRVIAALLFSKDILCTGQAQMSWISGDAEQGIFVRLTKVWLRLFVFYMNDISSLGFEF